MTFAVLAIEQSAPNGGAGEPRTGSLSRHETKGLIDAIHVHSDGTAEPCADVHEDLPESAWRDQYATSFEVWQAEGR
jgi:hypothetical protein